MIVFLQLWQTVARYNPVLFGPENPNLYTKKDVAFFDVLIIMYLFNKTRGGRA